jgi:hypothetical protein
MKLLQKIFKKEQKPSNEVLHSVSYCGRYEYFVEDEKGVMQKVADSYSLMDECINETDYHKRFEHAVRTGQIKGYIAHCC